MGIIFNKKSNPKIRQVKKEVLEENPDLEKMKEEDKNKDNTIIKEEDNNKESMEKVNNNPNENKIQQISEIDSFKNEIEINQNQMQKIILNDKLPKPTKWEIKENEPLYNLIKSDSLNLDKEMSEIFNIGEILAEEDKFIGEFVITRFPPLTKKDELLNRLKEIKQRVNIVDIKLSEKFEEIMNKYIKIIAEESNEENLDKLYQDYKLKAREILIENLDKKKINNESKENHNFKVYYSSFPSEKYMKYFHDHPVLFGFYKAWITHCPITISPNIIWQLILNVFIKFIDLNSENLREKFVNFDGKKELNVYQIIKDEITFLPTKEEWESIIDKIIVKVGENMGHNILNNFILDFSTNDKNLLFVQKVSLMSMFKKYFDYHLYLGITCGYPYINLEGSIKDWELIKTKLNEFKKYGLNDWINQINPILDEIINTKKGIIKLSFWKDIIFENFERSYNICGGPPKAYIIFSGWISKFFPFNNKGKNLYELKINYSHEDNPLSEFSFTPLIVTFPNNKVLTLKILSGIIGVSQDSETFCVKPELGFFILDEKWGKDKN